MPTNLGPARGEVRTDPAHMEEIVFNLAMNARDAMLEGGTLNLETQSVRLCSADRHVPAPPGYYVLVSLIKSGAAGVRRPLRVHLSRLSQRRNETRLNRSGSVRCLRHPPGEWGSIRLESGVEGRTGAGFFLALFDGTDQLGTACNAGSGA